MVLRRGVGTGSPQFCRLNAQAAKCTLIRLLKVHNPSQDENPPCLGPTERLKQAVQRVHMRRGIQLQKTVLGAERRVCHCCG